MSYILGIDMGIASIGFAAVECINPSLLFCGAHIFEAAENPKDGSSLALPRREKRGLRRVIRRRASRKRQLRALLLAHGLANVNDAIDGCSQTSPWDLRREGLTRLLSDEEIARVLFHICKRRGFQSNRKGAAQNDLEGKKALSGAKQLEEKMIHAGFITIGAYLSTLSKKRNGDGSYDNFVERPLLKEEVRTLFSAQRRLGNAKATVALEEAYQELAFYQRPLRSSENMIGFCSLEPDEKRAPRFAYTSELFILWSKLNHTKIRDKSGNERVLTQDEKIRLAQKAHDRGTLTYKQARKELELHEDERFNIGYRKVKEDDTSWEKIRDTTEKSDFLKLAGYTVLKKTLCPEGGSDWVTWIQKRCDTLDEIARVLSVYEDEQEIESQLMALGLNDDQRKNLSSITSFSKVVDLSLKAMRRILPHLQTGLTYDKACTAAGYDHRCKVGKKLNFVPPFEDIRNPVVNRALAQARKVINAVIRMKGMPEGIIVELARDVGRTFQDRKEIERAQKKNESFRREAKNEIAEILSIIPDNISGEDIIKYRLWKEQQGFCPYSGVYITPEMLRDPLATQVDHIIPYSRSWNNSYANKILCLTAENQEKGNSTPLEYFRRSGRDTAQLEVMATRLSHKKIENLLMENFDEEKAGSWKDRALNDTRYMTKLLKNHLQDNLDLPKGVQTRNGALTAHLRRAWGFPDKDRRNDRHHALDAIVIACSTQSMVQELANWNKYEARRKNPKDRVFPPKPWATFRDDVMAALDKVFVSRMPVRKITGAAHEETIRSIKELPEGERQIIQRVKLASLNYATLENMVDKERNIALYHLLKCRLDDHGGDAKKAFSSPIFMPVKEEATIAPQIKSLRVITNEKSGIEINGGLASNGDMVRVDVFIKDGKYYLVPLYVADLVKQRLPDRAIVSYKPEKDWAIMDQSAEFIFSLYRNDYVVLKSKKESIEGYYVGTHRGTGCIKIRTHDNDPSFGKEGVKEGLGVKTLLAFEKYSVDYFGVKTRIGKEQRLGVAYGDDSESSLPESSEGTAPD